MRFFSGFFLKNLFPAVKRFAGDAESCLCPPQRPSVRFRSVGRNGSEIPGNGRCFVITCETSVTISDENFEKITSITCEF